MQLRMWTYDLAREQNPNLDHLREFCQISLESGYNAFGLYLEHRFAYPSTPWSHGKGAVTPEWIQTLQTEFPELQIVPFINLLGHYEGFNNTEYGKRFAEENFKGLMACPSNEGFVRLANSILSDTIQIFKSNIIHIGGDETAQLGNCPACAERVKAYEEAGEDGKARLYGLHMGNLALEVLKAGKTPGIWGDMLLEHPKAADYLPKETVVFDWQYFSGPVNSTKKLCKKFPVVLCPTLQTYNASWLHLPESEQNVRAHVEVAQNFDLKVGAALFQEEMASGHYSTVKPSCLGVCLTTWECDLMGNYQTLIPAIKASGGLISTEGVMEILRDIPELPVDPQSDHRGVAALLSHLVRKGLQRGFSAATVMQGQTLATISFETPTGEQPEETIPAHMAEELARYLVVNTGTTLSKTEEQSGVYRNWNLEIGFCWNPIGTNPCLTISIPAQPISAMERIARSEAFLAAYSGQSQGSAEWAKLMGVDLNGLGAPFKHTGIRSSLKCRLLLYSNPFLLWMHHADELCGETGDRAIEIATRALGFALDANQRGVCTLVIKAVEFVRLTEQARQAYAQELPGVAASCLAPCRQIFDELEKAALANYHNSGGSLADVERCKSAREAVEKVIRRIKDYGDKSLGYLPSFEHLCHPKFIPHDQGAWWRVNTFANE